MALYQTSKKMLQARSQGNGGSVASKGGAAAAAQAEQQRRASKGRLPLRAYKAAQKVALDELLKKEAGK